MSEQKIQLESPTHALQNVVTQFDEESVRLIMMSGGPARMYVMSPKHAKRIMLVLQKNINEYEKKFGKLDTKLPEQQGSNKEVESIGFVAK